MQWKLAAMSFMKIAAPNDKFYFTASQTYIDILQIYIPISIQPDRRSQDIFQWLLPRGIRHIERLYFTEGRMSK